MRMESFLVVFHAAILWGFSRLGFMYLDGLFCFLNSSVKHAHLCGVLFFFRPETAQIALNPEVDDNPLIYGICSCFSLIKT